MIWPSLADLMTYSGIVIAIIAAIRANKTNTGAIEAKVIEVAGAQIEGLSGRIKLLEARNERLEQKLDEEIKKRRSAEARVTELEYGLKEEQTRRINAEAQVSKLKDRVKLLEGVLRAAGLKIPEDEKAE